MPRTARVAPGGMLFHVLNRGVGKMRLFLKDADFEAFERNIEKTLATCPMRICAYCLMWNHWHFVMWPENDGELGAFMQKLTITHVRHWQEIVNQPQPEAELEAIRRSVLRGQLYGADTWVRSMAQRLGLESTLRSRGRPRKKPPEEG